MSEDRTLFVTVTVGVTGEKYDWQNRAEVIMELQIPQSAISSIDFGNLVQSQVASALQEFKHKEDSKKSEPEKPE